MYRVIKKFADLKDKKHIYNIGDVYPREGSEPTEERIAFLASDQNKLGTPVIQLVPEKKRKRKTEELPEQEDVPEEKSSE